METQENKSAPVILKLSNGKEVIGKAVDASGETITLEDVYEIMYMPTESMIPNIMFIKYMVFSGEKEITFNSNHVTNLSLPRPTVNEYYHFIVQKYGTNIEDQLDKQLSMMMFRKSSTDEQKQAVYAALLESIESGGMLQ